MTSREELDISGPNAPLLASADVCPDFRDADEALDSDLSYSGGWFIWILTFSAGISGLLFGYEYDKSLTVAP
jgi:SP family myo-inositol transporter-like MFS transporter 13